MMIKQSAGILLYRIRNGITEYFLVHPGGPFFTRKDKGYWTIAKGEIQENELPLEAAKREFREETGMTVDGEFTALTPIIQKGGKKVFCWSVEADIDNSGVVSNSFELEWPPRSGITRLFPEIDKWGWFTWSDAGKIINERQLAFLDELNYLLLARNKFEP